MKGFLKISKPSGKGNFVRKPFTRQNFGSPAKISKKFRRASPKLRRVLKFMIKFISPKVQKF